MHPMVSRRTPGIDTTRMGSAPLTRAYLSLCFAGVAITCASGAEATSVPVFESVTESLLRQRQTTPASSASAARVPILR
jgi:hypothetical protein